MALLQLSPSTLLYSPVIDTRSRPSTDPKLVILATWIFARHDHIEKYVDKYLDLYPDASILVTKCYLRHLLWPQTGRDELASAAMAIRTLVDERREIHRHSRMDGTAPQILLHVFSNSGLGTSWQLKNVYQSQSTENQKGLLPRHVTIFDSSPGRYEYWAVTAALLYGIPPGAWLQRLIALPFAHILSGCLFIWCRVLGGEDWVIKWAQAANNPGHVQEVCRAYAYGSADTLVKANWIEAHATDASAQGFHVAQMTNFGAKSAHVAHSRTDPSAYWGMVKDTWKAALRSFAGSFAGPGSGAET